MRAFTCVLFFKPIQHKFNSIGTSKEQTLARVSAGAGVCVGCTGTRRWLRCEDTMPEIVEKNKDDGAREVWNGKVAIYEAKRNGDGIEIPPEIQASRNRPLTTVKTADTTTVTGNAVCWAFWAAAGPRRVHGPAGQAGRSGARQGHERR